MATNALELEEPNDKSAGIGAWVLKIYGMRWIEYEYTRKNKVETVRKLECLLVAQSGTYCHGVIKALYSRTKGGGGVDPAAELKTSMDSCRRCRDSPIKLLVISISQRPMAPNSVHPGEVGVVTHLHFVRLE